MPPNTVYVGRPTKWGNPYKIGEEKHGVKILSREDALREYEKWLEARLAVNPEFLKPLKRKDLACWCPLDKPCHADVILKILGEMKTCDEYGKSARLSRRLKHGTL